MRLLTVLMLLMMSIAAAAADRKALTDVDSTTLTSETQVMDGGSNMLDLVWWIPIEFWEVSLRSNPDVQEFQVREIVDTLRPYSVAAVVQANISNFGAFTFLDEETIANGMHIEYIDADGEQTSISHREQASPDVVILLNQMSPVLSAAMGNLGENFFFFPLPDTDSDDERLVSPYEKGRLRITLDTRKNAEKNVLEIELPLDALHIPRVCPNGKPAHVSWTHCPWGGAKLK